MTSEPISARADQVADWIETRCLLAGHSLSASALAEGTRHGGLRSSDIDLGLRTMAHRAAVTGPAYPFVVGSGASARQDAQRSVWAALLLMGPSSPARKGWSLPQAAQLLETITCHAVSRLYGPDTKAIRFGWPSDVGRPFAFSDAVRWLAAEMGVKAGDGYRPPHSKDGGVDVVAWRPFPDGRSGFPVLLVQCTVERNYAHKANDIETRVWSGWLNVDVYPQTALAIPDVVPAGEVWNRLAAKTIILDRVRLASLVKVGAPGFEEAVQAWTSEALDRVREAQ